jgi:hypothetical protein
VAGSSVPPVPDVPAILTTLIKHDVAFVVIGGVAVVHHGYVRTTRDIDIVPAPSEENLRRLWHALVEMEAEPLALGEFRAQELPASFDLESLLDRGNWDLATRYGRIDVIQHIVGKVETPEDHEGLVQRADRARFDFGTVLFASYEDLIDFKNLAGRDQDLIDIRALREARADIAPE